MAQIKFSKSFSNIGTIIPLRMVQVCGTSIQVLGSTFPLLYFNSGIYKFDQASAVIAVSMCTTYAIAASTTESFGAAVARVPDGGTAQPIRLPVATNATTAIPGGSQILYHQFYYASSTSNRTDFVRQNSLAFDLPFMPLFGPGEAVGVAVASANSITSIADTIANVFYVFQRDLENALTP